MFSRENPVAQADVDGPELEERGLSIDERAREVIEYLAKRYYYFTYSREADRYIFWNFSNSKKRALETHLKKC